MEFNEKVLGLPGTFFRKLRKRGKQLKEGAGSKSQEAALKVWSRFKNRGFGFYKELI